MDPETPAAAAATSTYPVRVSFDAPLEIARWRVFVHGILAIPHFIIMEALQFLQGACTVIAFFAILFTKKYPEGLFKVVVMCTRYQWRAYSYILWMRESYPPFEFPTELEDPGTDPAKVSIDYPQELNRWLPLVKWLLIIPHAVVLVFLIVGGVFVWLISFFAILFTGKYPAGMRDYMIGVARWSMRVGAYLYLMRDEYPPFSLD